MSVDQRFVFIVEWFDQAASLIRPYFLTYYPPDKTIEMYDIKNKRNFLKRCEYPAVTMKDLYVGATVTIYSRQLKVIDYGDVYTRKHFEALCSRTCALIKPAAYINIGKILDMIVANGFTISRMRMFKWTPEQAQAFFTESKGEFSEEEVAALSSDVTVGLELVGGGAVEKWNALIGSAAGSVGADAVHGSASNVAAVRELGFVFGPATDSSTTAILNNCACLIIKPDAVKNGNAGKIINTVLEEGFEISALELLQLNKATAEEFFDVYKEVLPEYIPMMEHLINGPIIVMEVRQENVVQALRSLVGPHDPEIARNLRPNTIRAKFGKDRVRNAVHCTDLPEDGVLECEYFFSVLKKKD